MVFDGNINLVRPLLEVKKTKLKRVSKIFFGKFYIDPTNKNTKYLRTRIRKYDAQISYKQTR